MMTTKQFWIVTEDVNKKVKDIVTKHNGHFDDFDDDGSNFIQIPVDMIDSFNSAMVDTGADFGETV